MSEISATGRFEIQLAPGDAIVAGTGRFDLTKTWTGEIEGTSTGVMLSAGDPSGGNAGYVAMEVFDGSIGGRAGSLAFLQLGTMRDGEAKLKYQVAPGSGTGELSGATGHLVLDVIAGVHEVTVKLHLPAASGPS